MTIESYFDGGEELVRRVRALPAARSLIAIAGPPGAGKSFLAEALVKAINAKTPGEAALVPMDGFHFDDAVLNQWGLRARKGASNTFDVAGLKSLLRRLADNHEPFVAAPVFDRSLEIARAGAAIIPSSARYIIVEGNYLLLQSEPWSELAPLFDFSVMIRESRELLEQRLIERWRSLGLDDEQIRAKVFDNDLPNGDLILSESRPADFILRAREQPQTA
ncbi:nucleoside triphosphate hydrolase [Kaistia sp. 32K]|uniref:nucleoside triphosphate hydrolase n=1 Tax=Kaistia sp. 32K TaxID=2795690 RepID=UPI00191637AD|nr:nucleoside triphosphate hydrolase [Kaistia sp. 32K]BCP54859.1 nucleoside triphosphate hydrolase [Kaistia sp. 32K]